MMVCDFSWLSVGVLNPRWIPTSRASNGRGGAGGGELGDVVGCCGFRAFRGQRRLPWC